MRKQDKFAVGIVVLAVMAIVVWALCTQLRWARSNKPIQLRPPEGERDVAPKKQGSEVIGPVNDDTRRALERNLEAQRKARERLAQNPGAH